MSGTSVDGIDVACVDLDLDGDELGCGYRGSCPSRSTPCCGTGSRPPCRPASPARASSASCMRTSVRGRGVRHRWSVTGNVTVAALTALWGLLASLTSLRAALAIAGLPLLATPLLLPPRKR